MQQCERARQEHDVSHRPEEVELETGDLSELLAVIRQSRVGHQHGGKKREPDAALDERRDSAALHLSDR